MSVKKEYYSFVIKERTLRRKLERKKLRFEKIERVYLELLEKQEEIKKCYAQITMKVLETINRKVEEVREAYYNAKREYEDLCAELETCIKGRKSLEESGKYIEEQVSMIVKKLKEFVAKNQQQLTTNVKNKISVGFKKRTICIPCDNLGSSDYHLEHHSVPNGIVEMRYGTRIIATSKDFFLQRKIYYIAPVIIKDYTTNKVHCTNWFKEFMERFYATLKDNIEAAFKEDPNFKVRFTDKTQFILELR